MHHQKSRARATTALQFRYTPSHKTPMLIYISVLLLHFVLYHQNLKILHSQFLRKKLNLVQVSTIKHPISLRAFPFAQHFQYIILYDPILKITRNKVVNSFQLAASYATACLLPVYGTFSSSIPFYLITNET